MTGSNSTFLGFPIRLILHQSSSSSNRFSGRHTPIPQLKSTKKNINDIIFKQLDKRVKFSTGQAPDLTLPHLKNGRHRGINVISARRTQMCDVLIAQIPWGRIGSILIPSRKCVFLDVTLHRLLWGAFLFLSSDGGCSGFFTFTRRFLLCRLSLLVLLALLAVPRLLAEQPGYLFPLIFAPSRLKPTRQEPVGDAGSRGAPTGLCGCGVGVGVVCKVGLTI